MKCQSFNIVSIEDDTLSKKSCTDYGESIISHEITFYKTISSNLFPVIHHLGTNSIKMEYLKSYKPIREVRFDKISSLLYKNISVLHNTLDPLYLDVDEFKHQLFLETIEKIKVRNSRITSSISMCTHINDVPLMSLDEIIEKLKKYIDGYSGDTRFHVIHGDLNFGNILYDEEKNDLKFIDPRGYFGSSKVFGPRAYDFAKIHFSLSGYDCIYHHQDPLLVIKDKRGIISLPLPNCEDDFIHVLCISMWLGAPLYFDKTDKLATCYHYGIYLATLRFGDTLV